MANFGETLTYWYLRLNGFFPLSNFVLHRENINGESSADTDLLAVRFPYVHEVIGGLADDWDPRFVEEWDLPFHEHLAIIVEVKTGADREEPKAWRGERLDAGLRRLGMFEPQHIDWLADQLRQQRDVRHGQWAVAKWRCPFGS